MRWPSVSSFVDFLHLPVGVDALQLAVEDLAEWTAALAAWHPDLAIGEEAALLQPQTYVEQAALRDVEAGEAREMYTLILRSGSGAERRIVAGIVVEYDPHEATMAGRMSVVSPAWRGRGLGRVLLRGQEALGRALGARSEWGLVELDNAPQQHLLESEGFWLCGIVPECDQRRGPDGQARYVPEALYIKPLVPLSDLYVPQRSQLAPDVAAMFDRLQLPGAASRSEDRGQSSASGAMGGAVLDAACAVAVPSIPVLSPALLALFAGRPAGVWPDLDALLRHPDCDLGLPQGVCLRLQTADDIAALTGPNGLLARWHPRLLDGTGRMFATAEHHRDSVALAGDRGRDVAIADRPYGHLLLCRGEQILAFLAFSVDAPGVNLFGDLAVVDPAQQGQGQMVRMTRALLWIAAALGVETVLGWATLTHVGAQRVARRAGLSLWGIVPASEVLVADDGHVRLAFEALYGASLIPPSQAHWPAPDRVPPRLRSLMQLVRQGRGDVAGA